MSGRRADDPWSRRAAVLAAPALLLLVACLQVWRVTTIDQSSWDGGGFGMFATIDGSPYRLVRGFQSDDDGRRALALPSHLERAAFELRVVPTEDRALDLGRRWQEHLGSDEPLIVEVWHPTFEPDAETVVFQVLRRVIVE